MKGDWDQGQQEQERLWNTTKSFSQHQYHALIRLLPEHPLKNVFCYGRKMKGGFIEIEDIHSGSWLCLRVVLYALLFLY